MNNPLVSVIIPTYKSRGGLRKSIESVLNQSYQNFEILVIDDNNPDTIYRIQTEKEMTIYNDNEKVIYLKHEVNKNGAAARNTGIRASKGELIAFLDDDDEWLPNKLDKQVDFLSKKKDIDAVYTYTKTRNRQPWAIPYEGNAIIPLLMNRTRMYTSTLLMTRQSVISIGMFDESFRRHQDYDLLIKFFSHGYKIGCLKEILVNYTPLGGNAPNAKKFVELKDQYLKTFEDVIIKLDKETPGIKNKILASNYSLAFYQCISKKSFSTAASVLRMHFWHNPICFIEQCCYMLLSKMKKKNIL